jgi:hypothetical protein
MMPFVFLAAFSLCSAAETAAVKAVVGQETTLTMDALPEATTDFAVLKAEKKDGKYLVTVLPLATGRLDLAGTAVDVVLPALADDVDVHDIKAPLAAWPALWPWLLLAALGAAGWYARKEWLRRQGVLPDAPAVPPVPLETRIESRLQGLAASGLWERGEHAAYYLGLTEILRAYLEERWGVPATAMTSGEVARLVRDRSTLATAGTVRALLERADLVKFARQKPGAQDGPQDLEEVRRFVLATSPRELAAAPAEAAR